MEEFKNQMVGTSRQEHRHHRFCLLACHFLDHSCGGRGRHLKHQRTRPLSLFPDLDPENPNGHPWSRNRPAAIRPLVRSHGAVANNPSTDGQVGWSTIVVTRRAEDPEFLFHIPRFVIRFHDEETGTNLMFIVIQVFLVTTLASSAAATVTQITSGGVGSITSILSTNLPLASNFYISYFILQGLSLSSGTVLQIVGLILYRLLGKFLDSTPRKMYKRFANLSGLGWGTVFPVFTNLCVIGELKGYLPLGQKCKAKSVSRDILHYRASCARVCLDRPLPGLPCVPLQSAVRLQHQHRH